MSYEEARIIYYDIFNSLHTSIYRIVTRYKDDAIEAGEKIHSYNYELKKEQQELKDNREEFRLEKEVFHNGNQIILESISHLKEKNKKREERLTLKEKNLEGIQDYTLQLEKKIAGYESEIPTLKEVMAAQSDSIKEYKALVKDLTEKLASISKEAVNKEIKFPELNFTNKNKQ